MQGVALFNSNRLLSSVLNPRGILFGSLLATKMAENSLGILLDRPRNCFFQKKLGSRPAVLMFSSRTSRAAREHLFCRPQSRPRVLQEASRSAPRSLQEASRRLRRSKKPPWRPLGPLWTPCWSPQKTFLDRFGSPTAADQKCTFCQDLYVLLQALWL